MQSWRASEPCMVSVVCITYNHELYLREAIESFLMQETTFPFEVIIHDDASTDNTTAIIKEYHSRYPNIVRPIYQKENQYTKGGFKPSVYAAGYASSEYIALCEGDDFWVSKRKLQIQIDAMESHPELDISFHSAYCIRDGVRDDKPSWNYGFDRIFMPDVILSQTGIFAPTPSYIIRRAVLEKLPRWFFDTAPVGDVFLEMYGAKRGGALYLDNALAAYRVNSLNSWSSGFRIDSTSYHDHWIRMIKSYICLKDDFSDYSDAYNVMLAKAQSHMAAYYLLSGNASKFRTAINESYHSFYCASIKQRFLYRGYCCPKVLRIIYKLYLYFRSLMKQKFTSGSIRRHAIN